MYIKNYQDWKALNEQKSNDDLPSLVANENTNYSSNSFKEWKKLLEQTEQQTKVPTVENAIFADILAQLNSGEIPGTKDSVAIEVWNSLSDAQISAMTESIKNYSKKLIKKWDEMHDSYRFGFSRMGGGLPQKLDLNKIAVNENYQVAITADGQTVSEWKYIEDVIAEINAYNASVGFKDHARSIREKANVKGEDGKRVGGTGYAIQVWTPTASVSTNQIMQLALLDVKENTKEIVTQKAVLDKKVVEKITAKSTGSKGFDKGSYELTNNEIIDNLIASISKQLEEAGKKQFTSIKVVSSASNFWRSEVPATHKKDGTILISDKDYTSEPFPGKDIDDLTKGESKNQKLAYKRGETIADKLKEAAIEKGIAADDVKVSIEWRVTDTGGKNDPEGVDPKDAGQYFRVTVEGLGDKVTIEKGKAAKSETKLSSLNFDVGQVGISITNLDAPVSRGNIFGIGEPRNIIVKKGGKFFKGGSRGPGGNRNQFGFAGYRGPKGGPSRK